MKKRIDKKNYNPNNTQSLQRLLIYFHSQTKPATLSYDERENPGYKLQEIECKYEIENTAFNFMSPKAKSRSGALCRFQIFIYIVSAKTGS